MTVASLLAIGLFGGRTTAGWVCVTLVAGALGNLAGFATGSLLVLDLGNVALVVGMGYSLSGLRCSKTRSRTGVATASSVAQPEWGQTARPPHGVLWPSRSRSQRDQPTGDQHRSLSGLVPCPRNEDGSQARQTGRVES